MRSLKILAAVIVVLVGGACSNKESFSVTFPTTGYYFAWGGEAQTVTYTVDNVASMTVSSITDGWKCTVDFNNRTMTITPPVEPSTDDEKEAQRSGTISFLVVSADSGTATYQLNTYVLADGHNINLSADGRANSYLVTVPDAHYTFDASHKGNSSESIATSYVEVVWSTGSKLLENLTLNADGTVSFYVGYAEEDDEKVKDDTDNYYVPEGNTLLAAKDASGNVLWSWHFWLIRASRSPLTGITAADGTVYMDKNLGAFDNSKGSTDATEILDSYGLYYQWGRKDPFLRPSTYNCAGNDDESVYNNNSSYTYMATVECDADTGTVAYAIANPFTYITNSDAATNKDNYGDWLYTRNDLLWNDTQKSLYDPCPAGWRVPTAADYAALSLTDAEDATPIETARKRYGWELTDGSAKFFFNGMGERSYYDGILTNMNFKEGEYPYTPEPWEGHYWTSTATSQQSQSMYFDLTTSRTINKFHKNYPAERGNAMQVRCVKIK